MTAYRQYDGWSTLTVTVDEATAAALEPPMLDDTDRVALYLALGVEPWAEIARRHRADTRKGELADRMAHHRADKLRQADADDGDYERRLCEGDEPITDETLDQVGRHWLAQHLEDLRLEHRLELLPRYVFGVHNIGNAHTMGTPAQRTELVAAYERSHGDHKAPFAPAVYATEYARLLDPGYPHGFRDLQMAQSDRPIEAYEWRDATRLWSPWSPAMAVLESHAAARLAYQRAARAAFLAGRGLGVSSFTSS